MKKLVPILAASASVVTGLALLSVAAFSQPGSNNDNKPNTSISASANPTPTATGTSAPKASPQASTDSSSGKVAVNSPNDLNISDVTTNSLKASWSAPDNTVGKIAKYTLLLKENGTGIQTFETTDTSFPITGLKSNTAYQVEVRAVAVSANGVNKATSIPAVSNTVVVRSPDAPDAPVQTSAPVSSPSPTPTATTDAETAKVVAVLTDYYKFVGSPDSLAKVKEAGKNYSSNSTDEELRKMVADFPEGFKFFDTSSSKSISDSYNQLFARTTQSNRTGDTVTVTVPVEAVTVKDGKATIDSTKLKVESKGTTTNGTEAPYFEHPQMTLTKNADGSWVLIPEPARQSIP